MTYINGRDTRGSSGTFYPRERSQNRGVAPPVRISRAGDALPSVAVRDASVVECARYQPFCKFAFGEC